MRDWPGWSVDRRQVERTRVLAALLGRQPAGLPAAGSVAAAVRAVGTPLVDPPEFTRFLIRSGLIQASEQDAAADGCAVIAWTPAGHRVSAQFDRAARPAARRAGAVRAVRSWLTGCPHGAVPADMLPFAHSWFYGAQFTTVQLHDAAVELHRRNEVMLTYGPAGQVRYATLTAQETTRLP